MELFTNYDILHCSLQSSLLLIIEFKKYQNTNSLMYQTQILRTSQNAFTLQIYAAFYFYRLWDHMFIIKKETFPGLM